MAEGWRQDDGALRGPSAQDEPTQHDLPISAHPDDPTTVAVPARTPTRRGPPSSSGHDREAAQRSVSPLASTTLCGRYRLEQLIGSGGMAQVWEATDLVLDRKVAVKVLHPHLAADENLVARFRQEAIAAARLSHPGIVSVYDTCSDGDHEAIVMELLDASTLRQHLNEHGPLDAETTVRLGLRLLDAIEAAHRAGLVHRDIKPSNILLSRDGRVRIADFGIAKAEDQTELTQTGTLVGTAAYLAPEQLQDQDVDARTDLYSLGIVLYECVTGRTPFSGETRAAVALARLHADPTDPRHIRADVPYGLTTVLMRTLQRDPDQRYSSAADLRAALLALDSSPPPPPGGDVAAPAAPDDAVAFDDESFARSERNWLLPALFILLIAVAVAVAGLLLRESANSLNGTTPPDQSTGDLQPVDQPFVTAIAFDPHGGDGENDDLAPNIIDDDADSSWRTSTYNAAGFFGSKTGVGVGLALPQRTDLSSLEIDGSDNGWSASVFVLDSSALGEQGPAEALESFDPDEAEPVALITDARGPQVVSLPADATASGDLVVLWITDLGDPISDGKYRVNISGATATGNTSAG